MTGFHVVFESKGKAVLQEFQVPEPGPDEVLLESDYSVVSAGTERANLIQLPNTGTAEHGFPLYPGYCASGRVVAAGSDVTSLSVGDRVIISWGGHRSHTIKKAASVFRIEDDSIDMQDAAFCHIASFSFLGVRKLKIELGEAAMVVGMGILGAFAVQIAGLSGAIPVLVSDLDPVRRKLALTLGASAAFSPDEPDFVEKIKALTGGHGPNAVVEVTGSALALRQALEYVAWEGRISLLGCTRISDVPIDFYQYVHRRGVSLIGAHTSTRAKLESAPAHWTEHDDYRTFLKFVAAGKLRTRPLTSEVVSPEAAPMVYGRLAEAATVPMGIVFDWGMLR
ncbi:MAG TPA: zinc-binding alcohol dehydrogenase [Phycisphaerae bacterium]|nr:zinc-binding alcohol dehydrogenase [Phycisphaerae bacterium]HOI54025.1 zinc-binding alcohol dehydrogenase [Phycisphaerae bacterium]